MGVRRPLRPRARCGGPEGRPRFRVGDYVLDGVDYRGSPFMDVDRRLPSTTTSASSCRSFRRTRSPTSTTSRRTSQRVSAAGTTTSWRVSSPAIPIASGVRPAADAGHRRRRGRAAAGCRRPRARRSVHRHRLRDRRSTTIGSTRCGRRPSSSTSRYSSILLPPASTGRCATSGSASSISTSRSGFCTRRRWPSPASSSVACSTGFPRSTSACRTAAGRRRS